MSFRATQRDPRVMVTCLQRPTGFSDALNTGHRSGRAARYICRVDSDDLISRRPDRPANIDGSTSIPDFGGDLRRDDVHDDPRRPRPFSDLNARSITGEITQELRNGIARWQPVHLSAAKRMPCEQVGGVFGGICVTAEDPRFFLSLRRALFASGTNRCRTYWYRLHDQLDHTQPGRTTTRGFFTRQTARDMQSPAAANGRDRRHGRPAAAPRPAERWLRAPARIGPRRFSIF